MADLNSIRNALAAQIAAQTGLRAVGQVKDQVSPPIALVLPGIPVVVYGDTMADQYSMQGAVTLNLAVLLLLSHAPPTEKIQRALDAYLGIGAGEPQSIPAAILFDQTLGGVVQWCIPTSVSTYGPFEYAAETYFGARINVQAGSILHPP